MGIVLLQPNLFRKAMASNPPLNREGVKILYDLRESWNDKNTSPFNKCKQTVCKYEIF